MNKGVARKGHDYHRSQNCNSHFSLPFRHTIALTPNGGDAFLQVYRLIYMGQHAGCQKTVLRPPARSVDTATLTAGLYAVNCGRNSSSWRNGEVFAQSCNSSSAMTI